MYTVDENGDIVSSFQLLIFKGKGKSYGIGITNKGNFYFDAEDLDVIKNYRWHKNKTTNAIFSTRYNGQKGHNDTIYLHRVIMSKYGNIDGMTINHDNHNRIDNRKCNLTVCSQAKNNYSKPLQKNNKSGFSGVSFNEKTGKWRARIKVDGKLLYLHEFKTKEDAIRTRLKAEKEYFGDFAPQKALFAEYGIE